MIIYKDLISGDELVTDAYQFELIDNDQVMKIKGKLKTETTKVSDEMFGGNKSAEGGDEDEGADDASVSGINVVIDNRLKETGFPNKKAFLVYAKDYMKAIVDKLKEAGKSDEDIDVFKKAAQNFVKKVGADFKEYQFFLGESMSPDGGMAYVLWEEETPYVYFLRSTLLEEKV